MRRLLLLVLTTAVCATIAACTPKKGRVQSPDRFEEVGLASYYAQRFDGRRTASGERYDEDKLTGAHRTLPFGTTVRVTNLDNGKTVDIRINDRGPFVEGRIIDVSLKAARELGFVRRGIVRVKLEIQRG